VIVSSAGAHGIPAEIAALLDSRLDKPVRQHELRDCLFRLYQGASCSTPVAKDGTMLPAIPKERHQMRILLAEDNKINQKYAEALLGKRFYLSIAENGVQAVDMMRREHFDVILMDVQMPELDGLGATRQIRALPAPKCHVPIIAMTANAQPGARAEYLAAGLDDYVTKPISPPALLALLERYKPVPQAPAAVASPQTPASDQEPVLDAEILKTLTDAMDEDGLSSILVLFTQDARSILDTMSRSLEAADMAMLAKFAHSMISSAGNLGARRVSLLARTVEEAAKNNDATAAKAELAKLESAFQVTQDEISRRQAPLRIAI
jgi:CheY-like chemotaxis protein/HPt (histidine-containing phosphotransfer) domain-containing protein